MMKEACLTRYPNIIAENNNPAERGLLALLREHTIDLSFLEDSEEDPINQRGEREERTALDHHEENQRDNFVIEEIKRIEEHVKFQTADSQPREAQHTEP